MKEGTLVTHHSHVENYIEPIVDSANRESRSLLQEQATVLDDEYVCEAQEQGRDVQRMVDFSLWNALLVPLASNLLPATPT